MAILGVGHRVRVMWTLGGLQSRLPGRAVGGMAPASWSASARQNSMLRLWVLKLRPPVKDSLVLVYVGVDVRLTVDAGRRPPVLAHPLKHPPHQVYRLPRFRAASCCLVPRAHYLSIHSAQQKAQGVQL